MSRILITGAAGFVGSHLADRLIADGHHVTGIDDLTTGREANVHEQVEFYECDVQTVTAHFFKDFDLIIHCAASYKDPDKWHTDVKTNVLGTISATIAARNSGCPIVYMQTALPPVSSYAISKTAGMQYIQQSGVPHLIFRLANIYGPRNLSGPIPTFYKRLTEGQTCTVVNTTRDMVYIDDLVECVTRSIDDGRRGVYDVCSGNNITIRSLYFAVAENVGKNSSPFFARRGADEAQTDVRTDRCVPGWRTATQLGDGIRNACDWYEANPPEQTFTHLRQTTVTQVEQTDVTQVAEHV